MLGTNMFSVLVAAIVGLMLAIPFSLVIREWRASRERNNKVSRDSVCYCNGVAIRLEDLDSRT